MASSQELLTIKRFAGANLRTPPVLVDARFDRVIFPKEQVSTKSALCGPAYNNRPRSSRSFIPQERPKAGGGIAMTAKSVGNVTT